jgi:hypothetical protein
LLSSKKEKAAEIETKKKKDIIRCMREGRTKDLQKSHGQLDIIYN